VRHGEPNGLTRVRAESQAEASRGRAHVAGRLLDAALLILSALAVLATLLIATVHVETSYQIDHVGGARMALAQAANDGTLYPPLHEDGYYGGTRFMPLPIVLHAGLAQLTGEYLVSGKLVAYGTMAALVLVTFLVLLRLRCPPPLAAALATLVLLSSTGAGAAMGLRADALPVLLQVLAMGIVTTSRKPPAVVGAGLLAAVAFLAKLSAVWAPMAIGLWFLVRDRRALIWFVSTYVAATALLVGVFQLVSGGRMATNVFGLGGAGLGEGRLLTAPYRLVLLGVEQATPAWFLVPALVVAGWYALRERDDEVWLLALACSTIVVVVVLADIGTGWNQLIDPAVLIAIAIGAFVGQTLPHLSEGRMIATGIVLAVVWLGGTALIVDVLPEVRRAVEIARAGPGEGLDPRPLSDVVTPETRLLSEDPFVPVAHRQRPVILDPFMLRRLASAEPDAVTPLIEQIRAREFELVVLLRHAEGEDLEAWFRDYHFGPEIGSALEDAYVYRETRGRYDIHRPRP
jgi:hypothetical protein